MNRMFGRLCTRATLFCSLLALALAVFTATADATDRDHDRSRGSSSHHEYDKSPHSDGHHDRDDDDDHDCSSHNSCGGMGSISGAIFTTDENASVVNGNLYDAATDVYLGGGPTVAKSNASGKKSASKAKASKHEKSNKKDGRDQHEYATPQPAGLPDGLYYFQVTNPSGKKLLSLDPVEERQFEVVDGYIQDLSGHDFNAPGDPFPPNYLVIQLSPFLPTDNKGGEYKVWVTPVKAYAPGKGVFGFQAECSKTDNFKLRSFGGGKITAFITGAMFADANLNGVWDTTGTPPEPGEPNVQLDLYVKGQTTVTAFTFPGQSGQWSFQVNPASVPVTYLVVPRLLGGGQSFAPTLPPVREVTIGTSGQLVADQFFGVVEIGDSGANIRYAPTYWANSDPNSLSQGEVVLDDFWAERYDPNAPLAFLSAPILNQALCPRRGPLMTTADVKSFLLANSAATAPASCQIAALWLSLTLAVESNGVDSPILSGGVVKSVDGTGHIYLGLDPVLVDPLTHQPKPVFSTLAELLAQVAAGYGGFGPLYEPFYQSALYQASENFSFVQTQTSGGGGGGL
jgi:hypothetical protein